MKEIKFRYIIKIDGIIRKFIFTIEEIEYKSLLLINYKSSFEIISRDQYINKKDKMGIELYENDIIRTKVHYEKGYIDYIIKYDDCKFIGIKKGYAQNCNLERVENIEKIGNKFENI